MNRQFLTLFSMLTVWNVQTWIAVALMGVALDSAPSRAASPAVSALTEVVATQVREDLRTQVDLYFAERLQPKLADALEINVAPIIQEESGVPRILSLKAEVVLHRSYPEGLEADLLGKLQNLMSTRGYELGSAASQRPRAEIQVFVRPPAVTKVGLLPNQRNGLSVVTVLSALAFGLLLLVLRIRKRKLGGRVTQAGYGLTTAAKALPSSLPRHEAPQLLPESGIPLNPTVDGSWYLNALKDSSEAALHKAFDQLTFDEALSLLRRLDRHGRQQVLERLPLHPSIKASLAKTLK